MQISIEYPTGGDIGQVYRDNPGVIIDDFYSFSWTERWDDVGEAILELPMKYINLAFDCQAFPNGHYLRFSESDYLMNLYGAKVKTRNGEQRVVLEYKSIENFLSFRRTAWSNTGYWFNPAVDPQTPGMYDLQDLWNFEFLIRIPTPMFSIKRNWDVARKNIEVFSLDFNIGDTVLDITRQSMSRKAEIKDRHGFHISVIGEENRHWRLEALAPIGADNPVDFTRYVEANDFAFDTSEYTNAFIMSIPHYGAVQGSNGQWTTMRLGEWLKRSDTFAEGRVRDWNRVETYIKQEFDETDLTVAASAEENVLIAFRGDPLNTAGERAQQKAWATNPVRILADTPSLVLDENLVYKRDFQLGTVFEWTPYAGLGRATESWFGYIPTFKAMITEFNWTIDEQGLRMTPGIKM